MEEHSLGQKLVAEFIGTALLVFIGAGSVPAILLLESGAKAPFSGADLGFISIAFGLIVDRDGLHDREGLGLPHQPGGHVRARRHEAVPVA